MFFPNPVRFLKSFPKTEDVSYLSEPRNFAHDESDYDNQYKNDPANLSVGRGLISLLRQRQADFRGPALEIGCGTGLLSLGIVDSKAYPVTILSDPSPAFIQITRKKVRAASLESPAVRYAILRAEEIDRLPADTFSLIVLRSTLHHVSDVDKFIRDAGRALRRGGVFACEEPCMEGYVLMGALAQFFPAVMAGLGRPLTAEQTAKVQFFVDTMRFYARRDVDKSTAEDKHLFRVDELMRTGATAGLSVEFCSNLTFGHFDSPPDAMPAPHNFQDFFFDYLKYCMSFDDELVGLFREHFAPYCQYVKDISANGNGPHLYGVFVCKKG